VRVLCCHHFILQQLIAYRTWQNKQENIDRTEAIIRRIALEVQGRTGVTSVIATLNE